MRRRVLDTHVLIGHWHRRLGDSPQQPTILQASAWADELATFYGTIAIVTPIYIEFVAGVRSKQELELARAYLGGFPNLDRGKILASDWKEAKRLAERVPRDGKPRQLGDCLIKAIATRFGYEVFSSDRGFPR